jgi:hypothetical protein
MSKYKSTYDKLSECRVKHLYIVDESGEPIDIVSNKGLKRFEKCYVSRNGEYHNFCIEAQEDIPSIITNHHIRKALEFIEKNEIEKAAISINISDYHKLFGDDVIYYTIDEWLKVNNINIVFGANNIDTSDPLIIKLNKYVRTERHWPINGKIKIVDIGINSKTKESVVPPEWKDRIFNSGQDLHSEMDKLPCRKGKPSVNYCCIYSCTIMKNTVWITDPKLNDNDIIYHIELDDNNNIVTTIREIDNESNDPYMLISNSSSKHKLYIQIDERLIDRSIVRVKTENVGYLSSLLQKSVRRGAHNGMLLKRTLQKLNDSPTYNLPDHNFSTVSGSRQLLWRSFISIIEDVKGYTVDPSLNYNTIDMRSLALLSIVFQKDTTIKLSKKALNIIISTMTHLQAYSDMWNWKQCLRTDLTQIFLSNNNDKINNVNQIKDSICLAISNMPMMFNDRTMLEKVFTYIIDNDNIIDMSEIKLPHSTLPDEFQDQLEQKETMCVGMDMHCKPTLLIELQAMLDLSLPNSSNDSSFANPPTLKRLAGYIWDNYSCRNFRDPTLKHEPIFNTSEIKKLNLSPKQALLFDNNVYSCVATLQEYIVFGRQKQWINWIFTINSKNNKYIQNTLVDNNDNKRIGRIAWLSLFGKKHRFSHGGKSYDVFLGGIDISNPCKIKRTVKGVSEYIEGELYDKIQEAFLNSQDNVMTKIVLSDPPEGYVWNFNTTKVNIKYNHTLNEFYVNNERVETLNLYNNLKKLPECKITEDRKMSEELISIIKHATYSCSINNNDNIFGNDLLYRMKDAVYFRRLYNDSRVFDWVKLVGKSIFTVQIWRLVLSRIYTSDTDGVNGKFTLVVGPCDRRGKKTTNSISYKFEGVIYRILSLMEMLYPFMMKRREDAMRWTVNKTSPEFYHMMESIGSLCKTNTKVDYFKNTVKITTPLWSHQERTSEKIFNGYTIDKRRGFGDASHVGAGKTLCALSVCNKLYNYNCSKQNNTHSGFLVMVPTISLIKTWTDEILKHTEGLEYYVQTANGSFIDSENKVYRHEQIVIKSNTIIVSTMGRIRDHPLQHSWVLVIIDECLSIQNKEALQTGEAWNQSCRSEYGIIMLSATFFRSRFEKMLYMLKMLKSGLPESREYLDAILNETIISNITESERIWTVTTSKIPLSNEQKQNYDNIYRANSVKGSDILYLALSQYIHKYVDYVGIFYDELDKLDKDNRKVVIFTKSKNEADAIINSDRNINNNDMQYVTRYPDKSGTHVVLSLSQGTYGINDLVVYDTILLRPPEPDKLSQIMGRLNRPGQKSNNLWMQYVLLENTIEEASLIRLEMCNNFYNNYLMPLAQYYDIATKIAHNIENNEEINSNIINIIDNKKTIKIQPEKADNKSKVIVGKRKNSIALKKPKKNIVRVKKAK